MPPCGDGSRVSASATRASTSASTSRLAVGLADDDDLEAALAPAGTGFAPGGWAIRRSTAFAIGMPRMASSCTSIDRRSLRRSGSSTRVLSLRATFSPASTSSSVSFAASSLARPALRLTSAAASASSSRSPSIAPSRGTSTRSNRAIHSRPASVVASSLSRTFCSAVISVRARKNWSPMSSMAQMLCCSSATMPDFASRLTGSGSAGWNDSSAVPTQGRSRR